jgi:hypothetical protein
MTAQPLNDQFALFDLPAARPRYPEAAGSKQRGGASEEAARRIAFHASVLRDEVRDEFEADAQVPGSLGQTADVATRLNRSVLSIRPRVSELHRAGQIVSTADRRRNHSGLRATVWRLAPAPSSAADGPMAEQI